MKMKTLFSYLLEPYKIDKSKPLKVIELFAGYGSQSLALKRLGVNFEHHKICEWAINSIQAYKDLHFFNDNNDYSKDKTTEEIKKFLNEKGISKNYNEPMSSNQIKKLSEKQVRTIYNNIIATHNLVNIQQIKGKDLEITDTYLLTYLLTLFLVKIYRLQVKVKVLTIHQPEAVCSGKLKEY